MLFEHISGKSVFIPTKIDGFPRPSENIRPTAFDTVLAAKK
jgi:hypothetical protein